MRDRGGRSVAPAKGTLKNVYHLKAYGYKPQSGFHPRKLLEALGLGGIAHPIRRLHHPGGVMAFPGEVPKLPSFMSDVARRTGKQGRFGIPITENAGLIHDLLHETSGYGSPTIFDKANPMLRARTRGGFPPRGLRLGKEKPYGQSDLAIRAQRQRITDALADISPSDLDPRIFGESLGLFNSRPLVEWMMQHHYRRPN